MNKNDIFLNGNFSIDSFDFDFYMIPFNIYKKENFKNLYKKNTVEHHLLNYILITPFHRIFHFDYIINYLTKNNITTNLSIYDSHIYFEKIINIINDYLRIHKTISIDHGNDRIGVSFSAGFNNLLHNPVIFEKYLKKDNLSYETLLRGLYFYDILIKELEIPSFSHDINQSNNITITTDFTLNSFYKIQNFTPCYINEDWLCINTRGLIHHIADDACMAISAKHFNQLSVIKQIDKNIYTTLDFNRPQYFFSDGFHFLKDVPFKLNSTNTKINSIENEYLTDFFWNNEVFFEFANRDIAVVSFHDIIEKLLSKLSKVLPEKYLPFINTQYTKKSYSAVKKFEPLPKVTFDSSFFYKTLAHKTHCDVVNPSTSNLSFFNKNKNDFTKFDIIDEINLFFSQDPKTVFKNPNSRIYNYHQFFNINYNKTKHLNPYNLINFLAIRLFLTVTKFLNNEKASFFYNYLHNNSKSFFYSDVVPMKYEYRFFIVNNKISASTPCMRNTSPINAWMNGRIDPRISDGHDAKTFIHNQFSRDLVSKYTKYVRKFCSSMQKKYPNLNYVLDVAFDESTGNIYPIEMNSIELSGPYQLNSLRLISSVLKKKFKYEDLISFIDIYDESTENMKNDSRQLISHHEIHDLHQLDNGLRRTLKAKTTLFKLYSQRHFIPNEYDSNHIMEVLKEIDESNPCDHHKAQSELISKIIKQLPNKPDNDDYHHHNKQL